MENKIIAAVFALTLCASPTPVLAQEVPSGSRANAAAKQKAGFTGKNPRRAIARTAEAAVRIMRATRISLRNGTAAVKSAKRFQIRPKVRGRKMVVFE